MSKMPEYDATAGFPQVHIDAFKRVAQLNKMVISSRELNPLCTDLVLEGYAAKGFHIKAKTCDWGPMAGFVPEDHRFTKGKQNIETQKTEIVKAFGSKAMCVPLFISEERFHKLSERGLLEKGTQAGDRCDVSAKPEGGEHYKFTLVKEKGALPGGFTGMWGIYYGPQQSQAPSSARKIAPGDYPKPSGLTPVYGMTNPDASQTQGLKSAVAGDYDLWCIFPHSSLDDAGIDNRMMPLRAKVVIPKTQGSTMDRLLKETGVGKDADVQRMAAQRGTFVTQQAQAAQVAFAPGQLAKMADAKEDKHLGNISLTVTKIKNALNMECKSPGGNLVQHSDYGGNPFGAIDYPIIFFVPRSAANFGDSDAPVATDMDTLKPILRDIQKQGYILKLNPSWSVPLF